MNRLRPVIRIHSLQIVHYYTCYIADKDRNRIVPVVFYDKQHDTTVTMMPAVPAVAAGERISPFPMVSRFSLIDERSLLIERVVAAGAAAVAVAAAARERKVEEPKVTDKLIDKTSEVV